MTIKKRANFFPELPEIENLLRKDKFIKGSSSLGEILNQDPNQRNKNFLLKFSVQQEQEVKKP